MPPPRPEDDDGGVAHIQVHKIFKQVLPSFLMKCTNNIIRVLRQKTYNKISRRVLPSKKIRTGSASTTSCRLLADPSGIHYGTIFTDLFLYSFIEKFADN